MEFHGGPLPPIPDDLTIPQFFLDTHHLTRPVVQKPQAWFVDGPSGRELYFEEIRARVHGLAISLASRWNIGEDDVVCIYSPNHLDYPTLIWATHRLGGIVTGANPAYNTEELIHVLKIARPRLLVAHPANLAAARAAADAVNLPASNILLMEGEGEYKVVADLVEDGLAREQVYKERRLAAGEARTKVAYLSFSSGTMGQPKAVRVSHYGVIANCVQLTHRARSIPYASEELRAMRVGDVGVGVLPFFHIYGLVVLVHLTVYMGGTLVILPRFDPVEFLGTIQKYKVTGLVVVPAMVTFLAKHPLTDKFDLSSVRFVLCGAAPLSAEVTNQLLAKFPSWLHIGQAYGMTEVSTALTFPRMELRAGVPGGCGLLLPGFSVRVLKDDGALAGAGEPGELLVRGPSVALGYLRDEEATKATFKDEWLHTGDVGYFDAEGELFIVDRIKEFIKVKGFQVAPAELEGHLLDHPAVADACVVGVPHARTGEAPLAFIVRSPAARARSEVQLKLEIARYVADAKIEYKRLTGGVVFVDAVPKNASGKTLRRVLRARARGMQEWGELEAPLGAKL